MKRAFLFGCAALAAVVGTGLLEQSPASAQTGDCYGELGEYRRPSESYGYDDRRRDDYGYDRDSAEDERRQLALERDRLQRERQGLEQQRDTSARASEDRCPPGFQLSERKCTEAERRRGCQDVRTPGGLGCMKR